MAAQVSAEPPSLSLPIDCALGVTCYIEDYVDADPSSQQSDFMCGLKSRDGHRGTDIVLKSFELMQDGVDVLAAAAGVVSAIRDGEADRAVTDRNRHLIEGRECGNAVRIDHGDGWQTLYCHMAKDSLQVTPGQTVSAGDVLGRLGLSGLTNIPHVHLGVLKDGAIVDPFAPNGQDSCGAPNQLSLWKEPPPYTRTGLFTAGFSTEVPDFEAVQTGEARMRVGTPDLPVVLYGHAFYVEAGDTMRLSVSGPAGVEFETVVDFEASQAQLFRAFGRKSPEGGWPIGTYRGYVTLLRDGKILAVRHADFAVAP